MMPGGNKYWHETGKTYPQSDIFRDEKLSAIRTELKIDLFS